MGGPRHLYVTSGGNLWPLALVLAIIYCLPYVFAGLVGGAIAYILDRLWRELP